LDALSKGDFVFVHVEAPDECAHQGDVRLKVRAIEEFDTRIVAPVWEGLERLGEPYRLVVATDHRTPIPCRGHTGEPVPVACLEGPVGPLQREAPFDETAQGGRSEGLAHRWMRELLRN
jgi:2,3-bisphosphoglycerate-independent phosphoglycerate mutase